ncbi:MAG: hypothetical protein RLZ21_698, partial [Pseudomonadota bacterium]
LNAKHLPYVFDSTTYKNQGLKVKFILKMLGLLRFKACFGILCLFCPTSGNALAERFPRIYLERPWVFWLKRS